MKQTFSILFVIFLFQFVSFGQSNPTLCPAIIVTGGSEVFTGNPIFFKVEIGNGSSADKIGYEWSVSNGKIKKGQGTPNIEVDTTDLINVSLTATVSIKGLSENCKNTASETGSVIPGGHRFLSPFDNVAEEEPRKRRLGRLENYLEATKERPKEFYLIKLNFVGKPTEKQIETRTKFIGKYLISRARAEEFKRLIFSIVESTQATTEYFIFDDYFVDEEINCKDCKIIKGADFYEKFFVEKAKVRKK